MKFFRVRGRLLWQNHRKIKLVLQLRKYWTVGFNEKKNNTRLIYSSIFYENKFVFLFLQMLGNSNIYG